MPAARPPVPSTSSSSSSSAPKTPQDLLTDYLRESTPDPAAAYAWRPLSPGSKAGLSAFLDRHPPSGTSSGRGPSDRFVWVCAAPSGHDEPPPDGDGESPAALALAKAHAEMESLRAACAAIDADERIPLRQTKAKGRSKAQRKKAFAERVEREVLPSLASEGGLKRGKWLFFVHPSHVDATLRTLAHSLVDGPLARLAEAGVRVHSVKAGCKDQRRDGENDFLVALFYEDVWDRAGSADLARCLLRNHKLFARAAKSDLWSVLGIDSRHWSGITSSLYNYDSLLPRDEQNELVELYEQERDEQGKSKRGIKRRSDAHEGPGREGRAKRTASASPTKPVDPAQFWPEESPDADGGGDDAEAQVKGKDNGAVRHDERLLTSARASVHTTTTPKKAKEPDPPRSTKTKPEQPPKRSVARDDGDSDSDTESEEEMLTLKLRSPSKSPVKGQGPGRPRDGEEPRTPAKIRSALQPRGPQGGTPGRDGAADSGKDEEKERERERGEAQGSARYEQQQQQQQRDRSAVLGLGLETRKLPQSRARETGNGPHEEGDKVSEGGAHEGATASTSSTKTHGHAHAHRPASARDMARSRGARGEGI